MPDTKSKNPYSGFKPLTLEIIEKDKFNFQEKAENIVDLIINPFFENKKLELEQLKNDAANKKDEEEIIKKIINNNYFTKHNTLLINGPTGSGKTRLVYEIQKFINTGNGGINSKSIDATSALAYKLKKGINKKILGNIDNAFKNLNSKKQIKKIKINEPQDKSAISVLTYSLTDFNYYKDYHANLLVSIFENLGGHTLVDSSLKFFDKYLLGFIDDLIKKAANIINIEISPLEKIKDFLFAREDNKYNEVSYKKVKRVSRYINLLTLEKPLVVILDGLDTFKPVDMEKLFYILNHLFSSIPNIFFIIPCNYDYITTVLQINKAKENYITNLFSFKINTKYFLKSEELSTFNNQFINELILCSNKLNLAMFEKNYIITQRAVKAWLKENDKSKLSEITLEFIFFLLGYIKYNFEDWYLSILKLSELDFLLINNLVDKLLNIWKKDLLGLNNKEELDLIEEENYQIMIFEAIVSGLINENGNNNLIIKTEANNYKSLFYFYLLILNDTCELEENDYQISKTEIDDNVEIKIKDAFFLKKPNFTNFNFNMFQELIKFFIINSDEKLDLELIISLMQTSIYKI